MSDPDIQDESDDDVDERRAALLDGWEQAASGWGRQADRTQSAAMPVSAWLISHANLQPGMRVLELAAGPGDTGFMAAEQVLPGGTLICSDGVEAMLEVARERAQEQGVSNVEFEQLQLEWIDRPTADVDVVLCRWGVMLTLDPAASLRECRRVLKPGGRLCLAVWDLRERNPWVTVADAAMAELGHSQPQSERGPGMFALSAPGALGELIADAGFLDVEIDSVALTQRYASVTDYIGQMRDLSSGFRAVWDNLVDVERQRVRERFAGLTEPYLQSDGTITLPGQSLVASAEA